VPFCKEIADLNKKQYPRSNYRLNNHRDKFLREDEVKLKGPEDTSTIEGRTPGVMSTKTKERVNSNSGKHY
jgi:hypothetical protein